MFGTFTAMLKRQIVPATELEARLRVEQVRAVAQHSLTGTVANPIIALVLGVIALQWVRWWVVAAWIGTIVVTVAISAVSARRILAAPPDPRNAASLTRQLIAGLMPFNVAWPMIVVIAWVHGNPGNNAFLIALLFASIASNVPLTSPCRQIIFCNIAIDIPILATHALGGGPWMTYLAPILQVLGAAMVYDLAFSHHKLFQSSVLQRFENKDLVDRLTRSESQLKSALYQAQQANSAKSNFLASMSHELRTPLNAIIGFSDMIRSHMLGPVSPSRYGEYVEDIHNSGKHLLGLINNVLDLAKIESGKRNFTDTELSISALAREACVFVDVQARKKAITVDLTVDERIHLIADERSIVQILTNLLSNAVKFTKPGGHVTVFANSVAGGFALGVEDNGIGMTADELKKALEPYGQVNNAMTVEGGGTGLGLPIVKALLEAQGASLHVVTEPGKGTRIWGEFPQSRLILYSAAA